MPKAKDPKEKAQKKPRKPVDSPDAKIILNVFTRDFAPEEYTITIPNIKGKASINKRSPADIAGAALGGLRAKYGKKVK